LTPKEGNAFLHGEMFTIQVLGILTNIIQLSVGGKESNILLFDVHQWPILYWDVSDLTLFLLNFLRHNCLAKTQEPIAIFISL